MHAVRHVENITLAHVTWDENTLLTIPLPLFLFLPLSLSLPSSSLSSFVSFLFSPYLFPLVPTLPPPRCYNIQIRRQRINKRKSE